MKSTITTAITTLAVGSLAALAHAQTDRYARLRPSTGACRKSNWVPTKARGGIEVMFRLYGPEKRFFDKTWQLPEIERLK